MTDDTKALCERLRRIDPGAVYVAGYDTRERIKVAAADMIESQAARIIELERELAQTKLRLQIALDPDDEPSAGDYECTR